MSAEYTNQFKKILVSHKYHVTKAREVTFNLLVSPEPQSIRQIIAKAKGQVDRVSVYRNIELFEKLGIVHRINVGWKYKLELSDQFIAHHHHLSCLNCGKIIDIEDEKHFDDFIKEITHQLGFEARRHQFEVDGYCKECLSKKLTTPVPL
ncbi:MAG TPA: Fur family transcriptional regulator [Candidatus Saccharimonadales bacterium]|nr:Fur family transcriptional regulator [Candidatus Saccharimonadales bacterium]